MTNKKQKTFNVSDFVGFVVTGVKYLSTQRFKLNYSGTLAGYKTAMSINLYRGSIWGITKEGKKVLLERIYN